jgi:hypothetical protein
MRSTTVTRLRQANQSSLTTASRAYLSCCERPPQRLGVPRSILPTLRSPDGASTST